MSSKCAYDCFRVDGTLEAYPDVSGTGVSRPPIILTGVIADMSTGLDRLPRHGMVRRDSGGAAVFHRV